MCPMEHIEPHIDIFPSEKMDADELVHYLAQNSLSNAEAHYLSEVLLNALDKKEQALEDVSRLEIEHKLSYEEANLLFIENIKASNEVSRLEKELNKSIKEAEYFLNLSNQFEKDANNFKLEKEQALKEVSRLKLELTESEKKLLEMSFETTTKLVQARIENFQQSSIETVSLTVKLLDCQSRLEQTRVNHSDFKIKSDKELQIIKQEKEKVEALVFRIQADLNKSLVEKEQLLRIIQKLEVEALDINLEGLSSLFEIETAYNLSDTGFESFCHTLVQANNIASTPDTSVIEPTTDPSRLIDFVRSRHIKEKTIHECFVFAVDKLIEKHYEQRGLGKSISKLRRHFPDTCFIS